MGELIVQKVSCKKLTNLEIRRAATGTSYNSANTSETNLLYPSPRPHKDEPHPWLLLEINHEGKLWFVAFSRNSVNQCSGDENAYYLGLPHVWRHHKHDSHYCRILDMCGKVNFDLRNRGDAATYWKFPNPQVFLQANSKPVCTVEDLDLIASVVDSSHLIERLNAKNRLAPSPIFLSTLRPGVRK